MNLNSAPYSAPANDAQAGILLAAIPSLPWRQVSASFSRLQLPLLTKKMHAVGFLLHLPLGPYIETHLAAEIPEASPRNKKSRVPPAAQLEIFRAAEAKRARKQAQNMLANGLSISEEL